MISEGRVEVLLVARSGDRLDAYVAGNSDLSRVRVQALIKDGRVLVNGQVGRKSERLEAGQRIEVDIPPPEVLSVQPEDIPLDIVFEDRSLVVVNKKAGMVTHPGPGHASGTLVNALLAHAKDLSGIGGKLRPGIVHRLDRFTSGLMVVAKSEHAYTLLKQAFRDRTVDKVYLALVQGHPDPFTGTIDAPIGRDHRHDWKMAIVDGGRHSVTHYETVEAFRHATLLKVHLETGRTHQIRVHMAAIKHPCCGDPLYGCDPALAKELGLERQWLHAGELSFTHPGSGEWVTFHADLPADLQNALDVVRQA